MSKKKIHVSTGIIRFLVTILARYKNIKYSQ